MMLMPGFQIYLRPSVTLTFDLLTPKVGNCFVSLPLDNVCHGRQNRFILFENIVFANLVTEEQTN